jgi:hypothetical protein
MSNPKFRVFLRKSKVRASFIIFFGFVILTVPLRSSSPWCPCVEFLSEEVWGRESSRLGVRLTL